MGRLHQFNVLASVKHIVTSSLDPAFLRLDLPDTVVRLVGPLGWERGGALELTTAEGLVGLSGRKKGWALELTTDVQRE